MEVYLHAPANYGNHTATVHFCEIKYDLMNDQFSLSTVLNSKVIQVDMWK